MSHRGFALDWPRLDRHENVAHRLHASDGFEGGRRAHAENRMDDNGQLAEENDDRYAERAPMKIGAD